MSGYEVATVAGDALTLLQLFPEEGREAITAVVVITFLIGLGAIYAGYSIQRTLRRLKATEPTDVASITPGPVAVSGVARPADDVLDLPERDGTCLAYEKRTREQVWTDDSDDSDDDTGGPELEWRSPNTSRKAVAFTLEDDTGSVLVEADADATLELTQSYSTEEDVQDSPHAWYNAVDPEKQSRVRKRTIRVSDLQSGDEVFVFGAAQRSSDSGEFSIVEDEETGEFIVADVDRDTLIDRYSSNAPIAMFLGGVTSLAMLGLLVYEYVLA